MRKLHPLTRRVVEHVTSAQVNIGDVITYATIDALNVERYPRAKVYQVADYLREAGYVERMPAPFNKHKRRGVFVQGAWRVAAKEPSTQPRRSRSGERRTAELG